MTTPPIFDARLRWNCASHKQSARLVTDETFRSRIQLGSITIVKRFIVGLLIVLSISTLRADDDGKKPLAEKLANSRWSLNYDSKMDSNKAWFILNPDMTATPGWSDEPGHWKVDSDSKIEMTTKKYVRILTFNKNLTEGTDQLGRKYRRVDVPLAASAQGKQAAAAIQGPTPITDLPTIAANKKLWPQTVVLKAPVAIPVVLNGQQAGTVTAAAGTAVQLISVNPNGELVIAQGGSQTKISAAQTNLIEAATIQQPKLAEATAQEKEQKKLQETQDKNARKETHKKSLKDKEFFLTSEIKSLRSALSIPRQNARQEEGTQAKLDAAEADLQKVQDELKTIQDDEDRVNHPDQYAARQLANKTKNLEVIVVQVLDNGVLARFPNAVGLDNDDLKTDIGGRTFFIEGIGKGLTDGDCVTVKAFRDGSWSYTSALGVSNTVQRWVGTR